MWRVVVVVLGAFCLAPVARAWTWPVAGPVLRPFNFSSGDPYAPGQHRGIDVGGDSGTSVVAPASGTVSFAGVVPSGGLTVTIETADGYAVTLVHLGTIEVARGSSLAEGSAVGTVGSSGDPEVEQPYVHLGVRLAADPQGYVDPLGLLPPRDVVPEPAADPTPKPLPAPIPPPAPAVPPEPAVEPDPTLLPAADPPAIAVIAIPPAPPEVVPGASIGGAAALQPAGEPKAVPSRPKLAPANRPAPERPASGVATEIATGALDSPVPQVLADPAHSSAGPRQSPPAGSSVDGAASPDRSALRGAPARPAPAPLRPPASAAPAREFEPAAIVHPRKAGAADELGRWGGTMVSARPVRPVTVVPVDAHLGSTNGEQTREEQARTNRAIAALSSRSPRAAAALTGEARSAVRSGPHRPVGLLLILGLCLASLLGALLRMVPRRQPRPAVAREPRIMSTSAAVLDIPGSAAVSEPDGSLDKTQAETHPGRRRVALRRRPQAHRAHGGLRRPLRRLRPVPPAVRGRRPDGQWNRRARYAGHGGRRS